MTTRTQSDRLGSNFGGITDPEKLRVIAERQVRALQLRRQGKSYRQIGQLLRADAEREGLSTRGFSHEQVKRDLLHVGGVSKDDAGKLREPLEHLRLPVDRIDEVIARLLPVLKLPVENSDLPEKLIAMKIEAGAIILQAVQAQVELLNLKVRPSKRGANTLSVEQGI